MYKLLKWKTLLLDYHKVKKLSWWYTTSLYCSERSVHPLHWQVLCSACCNLKSRLPYMDNKEARVCVPCHQILEGNQQQPYTGLKHINFTVIGSAI